MQADVASADGAFSKALLAPDAPVPSSIKGQAPKRFAVYRNNVTTGLMRALEANFPVVRRLLGERYFAGLAREFARAHPPASPLMFFYGEELAGYLDAQDDLAQYPYLADVALLEQQWRKSYHAADEAVLDGDALSQLAADDVVNAVFAPHAAMAAITSRFALHDIFTANRGEEAKTFDPTTLQDVLITRPRFEVLVHKLPVGGFQFFKVLARGECLGAAAELTAAHAADFDLATNIALMIRSGAFKSVSILQE